MRSRLFLLILFCTAQACKHKTPLEKALASAGNNRTELEKVLAHYADPADSLQRKAAVFLITYMPEHKGYYGEKINRYATVFADIDTASYFKPTLTDEDKFSLGEAALQRNGPPTEDGLTPIADNRVVSAAFLINNIDFAMKAWKGAPWGKEVSFGNFCDFILPYRIRDERLDYWRPTFYQEYGAMARSAQDPANARSVYYQMNWNLNTETAFNPFFYKFFPFTQSVGDIAKGHIGSCENTSFYATAAMRSAGLPVAYDYIPHWGSSNSRHFMTRLVGYPDQFKVLTNENRAQNTWYLVDFSSEFDEKRHQFTPDEMPPDLYIQYVRTIPKVYRYIYSSDSALEAIHQAAPAGEIASVFQSVNLRDVTEEYVTHTDVTIPVPVAFKQYQLAYLCVFDLEGWQPVAISRIGQQKAHFRKMGRNVMYLPMVQDKGAMKAIGDPFYIDSLGHTHAYASSMKRTSTQPMKLVRKYPLYSYTAYHSEILRCGRFEGSNDSTFTKPVILGEITHYPFYMNEALVNVPQAFRYIRYVAPPDVTTEPDNIAEVQFYNGGKLLKGTYIGKNGTPGHEIAKAFDNNLDSYYQNAAERNAWIGLDLGAGQQSRVTSIRYCPRNDTNCILPGTEYELYYWDGTQWTSLGKQTAAGYSLQYEQVPANGLYWLRCNSGGVEERIFTYQNGLQTWW